MSTRPFSCRNLIRTAVLAVLAISAAAAFSRTYEGVLDDPVVLGGWLYRSRCVRCHFDYEQARLAENFENERELAQAIGGGGCRISWARRHGGEFGTSELHGLAAYMLAWEENEQEPELPELPPLLPEDLPEERPKPEPEQTGREGAAAAGPGLDPALEQLLQSSEVVQGGWLYTNNCYRCHLGYQQARMGKGVAAETVERFIREGKTSTQMQPFSRLLGGNLKNGEIRAIVSYIMRWEEAGEPLAIAEELMTPPAVDPNDFKPLRLPRFSLVSGDPGAGRRLFHTHCGSCHGDHGQGYIGASLRSLKPVIRSDLYFKSVIKNGVPASLMRGWDLNRGGSLDAKEIDDLVSLLTSWEPSS